MMKQQLPIVINMQLLPKISVHFLANTLQELQECSNLSGRIFCIDLTPNSYN